MNSARIHPLIEIRKMGKTYRAGKVDIPALRNISLSVETGELVSLMGPSGCGKSTLLHVLAGLTPPTEGAVSIEGRDITQLSDAEISHLRGRKIGFVFQRFNLLPTLSIEGNINLAQKIRFPVKTKGFDVAEILDLVGLRHKEGRKPAELSIGEQQRAAIARAIVHRPALLLADEPTGNLDSAHASKIITLFSRMNRERGQTILLVTHNREVAESAGRMIRMRDGEIITTV